MSGCWYRIAHTEDVSGDTVPMMTHIEVMLALDTTLHYVDQVEPMPKLYFKIKDTGQLKKN